MARTARLILALAAGVLLAHFLALDWLAVRMQQQSVLREVADPMFTRQVVAQESPVPAPQLQAAAPPQAGAASVLSAQTTLPEAATPSASTAPAAAASAAVAAASAPAGNLPALAASVTPSVSVSGALSATSAPTRTGAAPAGAANQPVNGVTATASLASPTLPSLAATATPTTVAGSTRAGTSTTSSFSPSASPSTAAGATDTWPADTRLSYRLGGYYRGDLHGDARVQFQREGRRYQVRVEIGIGMLASVSMTSQGEVGPQNLAPRAYEEQVRSNRRSAVFEERFIVLSNGSRVPKPEGVQDTASQFVELSHRFSTGLARLAVGEKVSLYLGRPGGVDEWTYDVTEEVTLRLPNLGPVQAFHLKPRPLPNPRGPITAELWFAPTLQYMPVRIRMTLGPENFVDLLVEKIEQTR